MPSLSREEIEKIIIDLREKTELGWKYAERMMEGGTPAPSIFLKIELPGKSLVTQGFHQKSSEECQEIRQNYEQQLQAQLGVNPDEINISAHRSRGDLKKINVVIEITDMNVMEKIARQLALSSEQSSDSFKSALKTLKEPQELTELKLALITLFDAQEKEVEPGEWELLNDEWEYGRGKHSGRLALANSDVHIELLEDATPKSLLILDKNNNFQPITDPAKQIEVIQRLVNDFRTSFRPPQ